MTDPFDALREPVTPVDPDPDFAARLRERLTRAVLDRGDDVSIPVSIPPTRHEPAWPPTITVCPGTPTPVACVAASVSDDVDNSTFFSSSWRRRETT